jgi:hypothetical protein
MYILYGRLADSAYRRPPSGSNSLPPKK